MSCYGVSATANYKGSMGSKDWLTNPYNSHESEGNTPLHQLAKAVEAQYSSDPDFVCLDVEYEQGGLREFKGGSADSQAKGFLSFLLRPLLGEQEPAKNQNELDAMMQKMPKLEDEMMISIGTRCTPEGRTLNGKIWKDLTNNARSYGIRVRRSAKLQEAYVTAQDGTMVAGYLRDVFFENA